MSEHRNFVYLIDSRKGKQEVNFFAAYKTNVVSSVQIMKG